MFPVIAFISQQKEAQKEKSKKCMKTKERYISKKHRHDITSDISNDSSSVDEKQTREKEDIVTNIIIFIIKLIYRDSKRRGHDSDSN